MNEENSTSEQGDKNMLGPIYEVSGQSESEELVSCLKELLNAFTELRGKIAVEAPHLMNTDDAARAAKLKTRVRSLIHRSEQGLGGSHVIR